MKFLQKTLLLLAVAAGSHWVDTQASALPVASSVMAEAAEYAPEAETLFYFSTPFTIDSDRIVQTPELKKMSLMVDSIVKTDSVTFVDIKGIASIDGPVALNERLAAARAKAMQVFLTETTSVNPNIIRLSSDGEDWAWFEKLVVAAPGMPEREAALQIIRSNQSIVAKENALRKLGGGEAWAYMAKNVFPEMRCSEVTVGGFRFRVTFVSEPEPVEVVEVVEVEETPVPEPVIVESDYWERKVYVKTNAIGWLMAIVNAAFEVDIAPHFSFALPVYYSGWNYFKQNLKFRTFTVLPEFRWYTGSDNTGFFVNVHGGMSLYNYAKAGDWRYQDYKGHTPALGGGVGVGYRWYFCKNHRWSMEAALGAGVYKLHYSIFQNFHNGLIVGHRKRTFFGVDQAALSFEYSFGVQRKEVKK